MREILFKLLQESNQIFAEFDTIYCDFKIYIHMTIISVFHDLGNLNKVINREQKM